MTLQDGPVGAPRSAGVPAAAVPYQGLPAGIASRLLANGIDFAVVLVFLGATYLGFSALLLMANPSSFHFPAVSRAVLVTVGLAFSVLYLTLCWWLVGRTYGDRVMALRVLSFRGTQQVFIGALTRALFCVGFPVGVLWCAINRSNRSVQDVVLRTTVIYDW
jgi:uncharacterized RDD family membrane protein YckC